MVFPSSRVSTSLSLLLLILLKLPEPNFAADDSEDSPPFECLNLEELNQAIEDRNNRSAIIGYTNLPMELKEDLEQEKKERFERKQRAVELNFKRVWNEVMELHRDSPHIFVGEVNCTVMEDHCRREVKMHRHSPVVRYWTKDSGEEGKDYHGGRSRDHFDHFIKRDLLTWCDVTNSRGCDDREKEYLKKVNMKDDEFEFIRTEIPRLREMRKGRLTAEKKGWVLKRIAILERLRDQKEKHDRGEL